MSKTFELPFPETPEDGFAAAVSLRRLADQWERESVEHALAAGWTWAQMAEALGVTRQAVHKKHKQAFATSSQKKRRGKSTAKGSFRARTV